MRNLNLPNLLTILRLLLSPVAAWAIVSANYRGALAVFAIAAFTDAVDGPLARRLNCLTRFGAYLDPIADKALLIASYLALGAAHLAPWWLVGLVLGRDLAILALVGAALLFTGYRDFPPSGWGKLSTIVQAVAGLAIIFGQAVPVLATPATPLFWATAAATLWSGITYFWRGFRLGALALRGNRAGGR